MNKFGLLMIVSALILLALLVLSFVVVDAQDPIINEPIPPGEEVHYGYWYTIAPPDTSKNPVEVKLGCNLEGDTCVKVADPPSVQNWEEIILTTCYNPDDPNPALWSRYIREGSRKFLPDGHNGQPLLWKDTLKRVEPTPIPPATPTQPPTPTPHPAYIPMINPPHGNPVCDCKDHKCDLNVADRNWYSLWMVEYPYWGTIDDKINLDAGKGEELYITCRYKGGEITNDQWYKYTTLSVDCEGKPEWTETSYNGRFNPIPCSKLNGTASCIARLQTLTCDKICQGYFDLTDSP